MKRNNMFMCAYILFIIFSALVRLYWNFPMWNALVSAVTISSFFFAFADDCAVAADDMKQSIKIRRRYIDTAKKEIDFMIRRAEEKRRKCQLAVDDDRRGKIEAELTEIDENIKMALECRDIIKEVEIDLEKDQKKVSKNEKKASALALVGFFAFFCVMSFQTLNAITTQIQDYLSVCAFALILLTQYVSGIRRENNERNEAKLEQIAAEWEKMIQPFWKGEIDAH